MVWPVRIPLGTFRFGVPCKGFLRNTFNAIAEIIINKELHDFDTKSPGENKM